MTDRRNSMNNPNRATRSMRPLLFSSNPPTSGTTDFVLKQASGSLSAGGGAVVIDENGVRISTLDEDPFTADMAYAIGTAVNRYGALSALQDGGGTELYLRSYDLAQSAVSVAKAELMAVSDSDNAFVRIYCPHTSTGTQNYAVLNGTDFAGVNIGQAALPAYMLDVAGDASIDESLTFQETTSTPSTPAESAAVNIYLKADKLVIQFDDGGTEKFWYLDLTSTAGTWAYTTSAP